jgi:hypothetical protein
MDVNNACIDIMEYLAPWVLHMNRSLDTAWDCIVYTTNCNRYVPTFIFLARCIARSVVLPVSADFAGYNSRIYSASCSQRQIF